MDSIPRYAAGFKREKQISNNKSGRVILYRKKGCDCAMAMVNDVMFGKTLRKSYAKQKDVIQIPNLLKIQKDSYEWFL